MGTKKASSIYDNTIGDHLFTSGEQNLIAMENRVKHDVDHSHRITFFDQIIEGEVDGKKKRMFFKMSKIHSCREKDCHYPQTSAMPMYPYKIEYDGETKHRCCDGAYRDCEKLFKSP
ncbi:MAG TPA: hypothetical protein ENI23_06705 [bacterium]|nr:hypothetical protein [bacterium]